MKVQPIAAPATPNPAQAGQSSREKAIAAFMNSPVQDQNNIQPEEIPGNTAAVPQEVGQPDQVETKPEAPEETAISRQFAQLARKEKEIRLKTSQQEQALKQREEALAAREAKFKEPDMSGYIAKDRFAKDPLGALAEAGVNYDQLTQNLLQQPLDPRVEQYISTLEAKLKAVEEKTDRVEKTYADSQTQAYQNAVKQIEMDTKALVNSTPEFETIKATNSYKDVVDLIKATFDQDGRLLSVEEACNAVEDYLVDEAIKLSNISKIKQKLAKSVAPIESAVKTPEPTQKQPIKTLTNAVSTSKKLSARERAIAAFHGQLKT